MPVDPTVIDFRSAAASRGTAIQEHDSEADAPINGLFDRMIDVLRDDRASIRTWR